MRQESKGLGSIFDPIDKKKWRVPLFIYDNFSVLFGRYKLYSSGTNSF